MGLVLKVPTRRWANTGSAEHGTIEHL